MLPFVGRTCELAVLGAAWASVLGERRSCVMIVTGPPGVGKTRLVREFAERVGPSEDLLVLDDADASIVETTVRGHADHCVMLIAVVRPELVDRLRCLADAIVRVGPLSKRATAELGRAAPPHVRR